MVQSFSRTLEFQAGRAQTLGYTFMSIEQKTSVVVRHNDRAQQATH